ncbi:hypothetical protein P1J78_20910 [Psychromarinibacter sp. C21-152]|uniref:Uncharacterized protein n=1 Tax=Psychromarinibacter sediminicola TaxID=3033385 RepID=A0AAE3NTE5_9RHOB|nr:hypothetical protein [Psychromarinibacter sediminicola]MDF0603208.1 hypothetical protein [Psychromarinibacter sediminicola]
MTTAGTMSFEQVQKLASNYNNKSQFRKENPAAYRRAQRKGWLPEIFVGYPDGREKWTKERLKEEAQKYSTRAEFARDHPHAYKAAKKRGWLAHICQHMRQPEGDTCLTSAPLGQI